MTGECSRSSRLRHHDFEKRLIGRMIEAMTEELNIPISSGGSTTYKSELLQKGIEPDECYYVANEPVMRGKRNWISATRRPIWRSRSRSRAE